MTRRRVERSPSAVPSPLPSYVEEAAVRVAADKQLPLTDVVDRVRRGFESADPSLPVQERWQVGLAVANGVPSGAGPSVGDAADAIVQIARRGELFHDRAGEAYTTVPVGGHRETNAVRSGSYERYLRHEYWQTAREAPTEDAFRAAVRVIEAIALYDGPELGVCHRVAELDGVIWIDLGDHEWHSVRVTPSGWEVVANSPARFLRGRDTLPLPMPVTGGSISELLPFLHAGSVDDPTFVLSVGWLVGTYHPTGPFPLLHLVGEQGSGKTQLANRLVSLADPSVSSIRSVPRDERDLAIAARNHRAFILDNVSVIPDWLSDALCRLSTGGGFATRELYSDYDEVTFPDRRPLVLTSVPQVVRQPDLLDRTLVAEVRPIERYLRDSDLDQQFNSVAGRIFGGVLDALVAALANRATTEVAADVRMADHVAWVMAAESAMPWKSGTYLSVYRTVREGAVADVVTAHPVGAAVLSLSATITEWNGTMAELLVVLGGHATPPVQPGRPIPRGWPARPNDLGQVLRRLTPGLRRMGLYVSYERSGHGGSRKVRISLSPSSPSSPKKPPQPLESFSGGVKGDKADNELPTSGIVDSPVQEEELLGPGPTKADRARVSLGRMGPP